MKSVDEIKKKYQSDYNIKECHLSNSIKMFLWDQIIIMK